MPTPARALIAALRRSSSEFVPVVSRLDEAALGQQSACSDWTIAQVLSHLGSGAEIGLATLQSGKADPSFNEQVWDRWNAMSPAEQAAGYVQADAAQLEALEALDDEALASRRFDLGFLPEPVDAAFVLTLRGSEVALHRWDVEVALDPAASVAPYLAPVVLDLLPTFAPFFAKPGGRSGRLVVRTSDPDGSYLLTLADEGVTFSSVEADAAEGAEGADTTAVMPAEALARLAGGRLAPSHTPGSVHVEGALSLDDLRAVFPGY